MLARSAPKQFSPNAFLRNTVTIHVGDTVRWRFRGFHTVTFPVRGKQPPPFALPSPTQKVVVASGGGAATDELNSLIRQARQTAAQPAKGPLTVDLGRAPAGRRFTINAFFPSTINVRVGQTVQFTTAGQNPNEIHTVTLGPLTRVQLPFVDNRGNINPEDAYRATRRRRSRRTPGRTMASASSTGGCTTTTRPRRRSRTPAR